jgi:hypothetical protein
MLGTSNLGSWNGRWSCDIGPVWLWLYIHLAPPGTALPRGLHIFWGDEHQCSGICWLPDSWLFLVVNQRPEICHFVSDLPQHVGLLDLRNHVGKDICNSYFVDRNQLCWTAPFKKRENTHIAHAYVLYIHTYIYTNIIEIFFMICKIHIYVYIKHT